MEVRELRASTIRKWYLPVLRDKMGAREVCA